MAAEPALSSALLRIRRASPFFATLSLFSQYEFGAATATAATDGKTVLINRAYFDGLDADQRAGLLLHEILHAALQHIGRRGGRDPWLWNVAADLVVNHMIRTHGRFVLPPGALDCPALGQLSVEQVYEVLHCRTATWVPPDDFVCDLLPAHGPGDELKVYWDQAMQRAHTVDAMSRSAGSLPAGLLLDWKARQGPQIDWRAALWRFIGGTPGDFQGFDRRFIHRGLYLDQLETQTCNVHICVDTSASVSRDELGTFCAEVEAIRGSYPDLKVDLYFADAHLYGPYPLSAAAELPAPRGGGGTRFTPFFTAMERQALNESVHALVYFTDGFGAFPEVAPALPVMWAVTSGGMASEEFPFGQVVRLFSGA